jgi:hypothetical protein
VYTDDDDGGGGGGDTWYPEACKILRLKYYLHSPLEKSLIERIVVQYFKDRVESFDSMMTIIHAIVKE